MDYNKLKTANVTHTLLVTAADSRIITMKVFQTGEFILFMKY